MLKMVFRHSYSFEIYISNKISSLRANSNKVNISDTDSFVLHKNNSYMNQETTLYLV